MKILLRLNFLLLVIMFALSSCDKDDEVSIEQQRIETLAAGAWSLTSSTLNGVERDFGGTLVSHSQTHGFCNIADGDCNGSNAYVLELDNNGGTISGGAKFTYSVHDENMITLNTTESTTNGVTTSCTSNCTYTFTILEWSDTRHVIETTDANGDVWTRTMERL